MSAAKHTPGPLTVKVENKWPFKIQTMNADGEIVFSRNMPCYSTSHKNAAQAIAAKDMDPEWRGAEKNAQAIADEVLRASAPDLLEALRHAVLQIEYLHDKFKETGTGNAVLEQARAAIARATGEQS